VNAFIQANDLLVAPAAGADFSNKVTCAPDLARCIAIEAPTIPPPTTPTDNFGDFPNASELTEAAARLPTPLRNVRRRIAMIPDPDH
jgi:hypothetical protein